MTRLTVNERETIARTRLVRILGKHVAAPMRTLEMKISDAGPYGQRINPHVLTKVRKDLQRTAVIAALDQNVMWYYLTETPTRRVRARLAEMSPIQRDYNNSRFVIRMGQTLEIATFRALADTSYDFHGRFTDLDDHDDSTSYSKEEPPNYLSRKRAIPGDKRLDFMMRSGKEWAGIECKNIREWIYPDRAEIRDLLYKCLHLDCIPTLIARRIHPATFFLLNKCGVIFHQTYNQLLPQADLQLANKAKDKNLLGYADIRLGNEPDGRLLRFIGDHLPGLLEQMRPRFDEYRDLLEAFAHNSISYPEFAARVRQRHTGVGVVPPGADDPLIDFDEEE